MQVPGGRRNPEEDFQHQDTGLKQEERGQRPADVCLGDAKQVPWPSRHPHRGGQVAVRGHTPRQQQERQPPALLQDRRLHHERDEEDDGEACPVLQAEEVRSRARKHGPGLESFPHYSPIFYLMFIWQSLTPLLLSCSTPPATRSRCGTTPPTSSRRGRTARQTAPCSSTSTPVIMRTAGLSSHQHQHHH